MQLASVYDITGSSSTPSAVKPGSTVPHAPLPVAALANAEPLLDALEVGQQVRLCERLAAIVDEPGRGVPLLVVLLARAQRHLRVDRGRAARTTTAKHHQRWLVGGRRLRECHRPPQLVGRAGLPARVIGSRSVRPALEQQHATPGLGELRRDDAAARAGADDDDLVALAHPETPR
jgi:hypothetical protein